MNEDGDTFEKLRNGVLVITAIVGLAYALVQGFVQTRDLFSFKGGDTEFKFSIALGHAFFSGMAVWGLGLLLTLCFAPKSWLLNSATGQEWMKRSGLSRTNTLGLRIMSLIVSVIALGWVVLSVVVLIEVLTKTKVK